MNELLIVNPRRRKRRKNPSGKTRSRRRRRNPVFKSYKRRRRSNPMPRISTRGALALITPAAIGAGGAVLLDVLMAYVPVPENFKTGWIGTGVKAAAAVGLGWGAGKVLGKRTGVLFTAGALTVIAYQIVSKLAADTLGDKVKGLSGYQDFVDYRTPGDSMGAYMQPGASLGYMSPAGVVPNVAQSDGMGAYMNDMGM